QKFRGFLPLVGLKADKDGFVKTLDAAALADLKPIQDYRLAVASLVGNPMLVLADLKLPLDSQGNPRARDLIEMAQVPLKLDEKGHVNLNDLIALAARGDPVKMRIYRDKVGLGVQAALTEQFEKFDLTGKTWASLTRSKEAAEGSAGTEAYRDRGGSGLLNRGAQRYQTLVPAYTVMFAFFLVLNVGWVFVGERTQGTLKRLRAAPISRGQGLLGKLGPYFLLSLGQGAVLLRAGRP